MFLLMISLSRVLFHRCKNKTKEEILQKKVDKSEESTSEKIRKHEEIIPSNYELNMAIIDIRKLWVALITCQKIFVKYQP